MKKPSQRQRELLERLAAGAVVEVCTNYGEWHARVGKRSTLRKEPVRKDTFLACRQAKWVRLSLRGWINDYVCEYVITAAGRKSLSHADSQ